MSDTVEPWSVERRVILTRPFARTPAGAIGTVVCAHPAGTTFLAMGITLEATDGINGVAFDEHKTIHAPARFLRPIDENPYPDESFEEEIDVVMQA